MLGAVIDFITIIHGPIRAVRRRWMIINGLWPLVASPRAGSPSATTASGTETIAVLGYAGSFELDIDPLLVFIPEKVNRKPLTLNSLARLLQKIKWRIIL